MCVLISAPSDNIVTLLLSILGDEESPKVLGIGMAKLLLAGMTTDERARLYPFCTEHRKTD